MCSERIAVVYQPYRSIHVISLIYFQSNHGAIQQNIKIISTYLFGFCAFQLFNPM